MRRGTLDREQLGYAYKQIEKLCRRELPSLSRALGEMDRAFESIHQREIFKGQQLEAPAWGKNTSLEFSPPWKPLKGKGSVQLSDMPDIGYRRHLFFLN